MSFSSPGNPKPPLLKKFPAFALSLCPQDKPAKEDAHETFLETQDSGIPARNPDPAHPRMDYAAKRNRLRLQRRRAGGTDDKAEPIPDAGEGHLMTIAPTGAGKGRSAIVPTLLSYPGPVIVIDPKGENYQVTARRRIEMGQQVYKLDPFGVTGDDSHSLNLLDTFDADAPDAYDQAMAMAELMAPNRFVTDPFWDDSARLLITTLILHVASVRPPVLRNLGEVAYLLNQSTEDLGFTIKEMLRSKHEMVRRLAAGLSATEPKVWASILSTAKAATGVFNGPNFDQISGRTDIPLEGIVRGDPISIYLILPPEKLDSHGRFSENVDRLPDGPDLQTPPPGPATDACSSSTKPPSSARSSSSAAPSRCSEATAFAPGASGRT